ncbi:J domain-containing protein 1 [Coniothyrium glycines]
MLSKKSALLLSSHAALSPLPLCHSLASPPPSSSPSWPPWPSCRHAFAPPQLPQHAHARCYAHHSAARDEADLLHWPEPVKPHSTPTPYQILRCQKSDAYSKHRFYALVKLYHPDRCHPASPVASLPLHVRLDRYRLLVAAHDILSDMEKRKAYDAWGHGWSGHHSTPSAPNHHHHHHRDWDYDARRWTTDPRSNATWEDWERWHQENDGAKDQSERTLQMSNFAFISLLFAFVTIGGVVQGTRFSTFNNSVIERRDQIHRDASIEYRRSRNATLHGDRDERIRTFLEHREANIGGEQAYQRLLPPSEACSSDNMRRQ